MKMHWFMMLPPHNNLSDCLGIRSLELSFKIGMEKKELDEQRRPGRGNQRGFGS
jgi:hypothetical protein